MNKKTIGVLGASSVVGASVVRQLADEYKVVACSRTPDQHASSVVHKNLEWRRFPDESEKETIETWVCLVSVWVLTDLLSELESYGIRRIIFLTSTSQYTKAGSSDSHDAKVASKLVSNEKAVVEWCKNKGIEWIVFRPTLIYGLKKDLNVTSIARFIRRFGFFPLFGAAAGLRQPIHVNDVAQACLLAVNMNKLTNRGYNLSGAEVLSYIEMVRRVFQALNKKSRIVKCPLWIFRIVISVAHILPGLRKRTKYWTLGMAQRMNQDMVFSHSDAAEELNFKPQKFELGPDDI